MTHTITVEYTTDDDGIWLICSCGWDHCCGYGPTVNTLIERQEEHLMQVESNQSGM